jgi:hypothetical protein
VAFNDLYRKQVALLVKALPHVANEKCFALKGGTAINRIFDQPRSFPALATCPCITGYHPGL